MRKIVLLAGCLSGLLCSTASFAQFNLDGQLIQRTEYRHGYNRPLPEGFDPAAFIAHRARLQASYQRSAFQFFASVQDVRTWGNTSQTKLTDNNLSVHEAWLEMALSPTWKLKLGRQELNYDNARFLGNLDWALQARAHDFALAKWERGTAKFHFGGGYNQDGQQLANNTFTVPNQYKSALMARYENVIGKLQFSLLGWNEGRQVTRPITGGTAFGDGQHYRQTIGVPTLRLTLGNTQLSGFYYHQLGKDGNGRKLNAFDASAQVLQQINIDTASGRKLRLVAGAEVLSGTRAGTSNKSSSFSPQYGTNHLHNGYMDLFYVGGAHEGSVGLKDLYVRGRLDINQKLFTQLDGHYFSSYADVFNAAGAKMDRYLGTEVDVSVGYLIHDALSLQGGYSQLFYSDTFERVQSNFSLKQTQNWAYLMLIFRPNMKNKFIGILL
ncbi:alginate export family protein [Pseudocnuella soli]|uniref:alginate export family protein n=1 Tax=Pseudocnuella soli TaxID=2502779 RepID=UPI00104583EF|nr:alginate export family protein [Pseudocnuella soli]